MQGRREINRFAVDSQCSERTILTLPARGNLSSGAAIHGYVRALASGIIVVLRLRLPE
jgi:hypothetical protein